MPGEETAAGISTGLDVAPPEETSTLAAPEVLKLSGSIDTTLSADREATGSAVPSIRICASAPKPEPRASIASPAESGTAYLLAKFTTESSVTDGAGVNAMRLARIAPPGWNCGGPEFWKNPDVQPPRRMSPFGADATPTTLNARVSPA